MVLIIILSLFANPFTGPPEKGNLDKIVKRNAQLIKISTGYGFTEGPAVSENGNVYFTDSPNNKIYIWEEDDSIAPFDVDGERSNGLYFSNDGKLLACADLHNKLLSIDENGKKMVLADQYQGRHFNGPNDVWQHPNGNIYFTDPYYHRPWWPSEHKELQKHRSVYCLDTNRELQQVAANFVMPNGIIGTPDGKYLYVADANDKKTWRFSIKQDGLLGNRTLFANEGSDGMTIDNRGNIYLTTRMEVLILNKRGEKTGKIDIPEKPSNCCFGGKNRNILFITAGTSIYKIETKVKGVK